MGVDRMTECKDCYHYGKMAGGKIGCAIEHKREVCPGDCHEFVYWGKKR